MPDPERTVAPYRSTGTSVPIFAKRHRCLATPSARRVHVCWQVWLREKTTQSIRDLAPLQTMLCDGVWNPLQVADAVAARPTFIAATTKTAPAAIIAIRTPRWCPLGEGLVACASARE
jgi:hypothetical protein